MYLFISLFGQYQHGGSLHDVSAGLGQLCPAGLQGDVAAHRELHTDELDSVVNVPVTELQRLKAFFWSHLFELILNIRVYCLDAHSDTLTLHGHSFV